MRRSTMLIAALLLMFPARSASALGVLGGVHIDGGISTVEDTHPSRWAPVVGVGFSHSLVPFVSALQLTLDAEGQRVNGPGPGSSVPEVRIETDPSLIVTGLAGVRLVPPHIAGGLFLQGHAGVAHVAEGDEHVHDTLNGDSVIRGADSFHPAYGFTAGFGAIGSGPVSGRLTLRRLTLQRDGDDTHIWSFMLGVGF